MVEEMLKYYDKLGTPSGVLLLAAWALYKLGGRLFDPNGGLVTRVVEAHVALINACRTELPKAIQAVLDLASCAREFLSLMRSEDIVVIQKSTDEERRRRKKVAKLENAGATQVDTLPDGQH